MVVPKGYERAVKSLWKDKAVVFIRKSVEADDGSEAQREVAVLEDEPCRIVYVSSPATSDSRGAPAKTQVIKLLIDRGAELPPGSRISVLRENTTVPEEYKHAGMAGVYTVHKEITLDAWGGWA